MNRTRRIALMFAITFAASAQLAAQGATVAASPPDDAVVSAAPAVQQPVAQTDPAPVSLAPTNENARVGVKEAKLAPAPFALPPRERTSSSVAMMIVGGAVLIVGAVVGGTPGTIIMIGGGVVGILGLIRYLQ